MASPTNLGVKLIATGAESGTWGDSTNTNWEIIDAAITGYFSYQFVGAHSSGSPYVIGVTDYSTASSDARNRILEFTSNGDYGDQYVQISPSDFVGYYFIRNNFNATGTRNLIVFQGTYSAGNAVTIPYGTDMVIRCDGLGVVTSVLKNPNFNSVTAATLSTANLNVTTGATADLPMGGFKITGLGTPTAGTDAVTKTYADSAAGIVFASGHQIMWRGATLPTGWTRAAQNDKALRIVSGGTYTDGGATAFTSVFGSSINTGSTTLTLSQIPAHTHTYTKTEIASGSPPFFNGDNSSLYRTYVTTATSSAGGGTGHTHTMSMNLAYYDMNVIQKT